VTKPETQRVRWNKVTLIGVGLLGGSLGLALRQRQLAKTVTGFVRRAASVRECLDVGAVDVATRDIQKAVENADLIILCTPISQMRPLVAEFLPVVKVGAIITDVGSAKADLVQQLERLVSSVGAHFVGSHPMAGAEKMGVKASRPGLFVNAICIITPTGNSNARAVRNVSELWRAVGSHVMRLTPAQHDALVSRSSHLPHLVAAALANLVLDPVWPKEQRKLCANGFRDTTRIASGSPEMWRDIGLANQKHLEKALGLFINRLESVRKLIARGNPKQIEAFLEQAKFRRDKWQGVGGTSE
jgi:prephenate dehydrogenase